MEDDVETGVAIVGGGFTGLSTALHAAERGLDCHVLEARRIGHGGSGRNVGLLNRRRVAAAPGGPRTPRRGTGHRPDEGARRRAGVCDVADRAAPDPLRAHAERHHPRRPLAARPAGPRAAGGGVAKAWRAGGAPVEGRRSAEKIGSDVYHGGLLDRRAGTINPMGYVRGLARAALSAGARISTGVTAQTRSAATANDGSSRPTGAGFPRGPWSSGPTPIRTISGRV